MSIRASKEVVRQGLSVASLEQADSEQNRGPAVAALFKSADLYEGPTAFAQKRKPNWKGR
jgi:enoyl-CoA hydratase/carnithine racemase